MSDGKKKIRDAFTPSSPSDAEARELTRQAVEEKVRALHDAEIVDFIRDTVVRLETLAERLEAFADTEGDDSDAGRKRN